jgi:hypothetical protein
MALSPLEIDAGFAQLRAERALQKRMHEVRDPDFWRALNPELTVTEFPLAERRPRPAAVPALAERCREQIIADGYLATPPLIPADELARLARGIERVVEAGFPSPLAAVYDEYFNIFNGLEPVFAPLLGDDYIMVTQGIWAFHVPAGDDGRTLWTAASPHRDRMAPDARTMAHDVPSIITLWIPLEDVTPDQSCVYVIPAPFDEDFYTPERMVHPEKIRLQDIRALPAKAGSVMGWSSHLIHWGSRASKFAERPRMSVTMYFQRRDTPLWHPFHIDPSQPSPFLDRLMWIDHSMARPGMLSGQRPEGV